LIKQIEVCCVELSSHCFGGLFRGLTLILY
jgi:hypothetical protein